MGQLVLETAGGWVRPLPPPPQVVVDTEIARAVPGYNSKSNARLMELSNDIFLGSSIISHVYRFKASPFTVVFSS